MCTGPGDLVIVLTHTRDRLTYFVQNICNRDRKEVSLLPLCHSVQDLRDLSFTAGQNERSFAILLLRWSTRGSEISCMWSTTVLLLASEQFRTIAVNPPGDESHAFVMAHREDVTFDVSCLRRQPTLVNRKWPQAVLARITISLGNNPCRSVADPEVQYLALLYQGIQGLHELRYASGKVPAVDIELGSVRIVIMKVNMRRTRST